MRHLTKACDEGISKWGGQREVALQCCDYQYVYPEFHLWYGKTLSCKGQILPLQWPSAALFVPKAFSIKHDYLTEAFAWLASASSLAQVAISRLRALFIRLSTGEQCYFQRPTASVASTWITIPYWRGSQRPCQAHEGDSKGTRRLSLGIWLRSAYLHSRQEC